MAQPVRHILELLATVQHKLLEGLTTSIEGDTGLYVFLYSLGVRALELFIEENYQCLSLLWEYDGDVIPPERWSRS